jgi:hypothetical protein
VTVRLFCACLILAVVGPAATAVVAADRTSEWIFPGPNGKLAYKKTPAGDQIMDFSSAGYMGGGVALPTVPVKRTVKPTGNADDTATIQAAIDKVAAMPLTGGFRGAVLLAPGVFTCSNTIVISASGVVLRGSGSGVSGKTSTIKMVGRRHVAITTRGEGRGRDRTSDRSAEAAASTLVADRYVPSGAKLFSVHDAKGFRVGDVIQIRRPVTTAWVKFMSMDDMTRDGRPQTWMQRRSGVGEQLPAAHQIDPVVGLTPIGGAAPHRHQTTGTQPAEMVGDQTLRLADQTGQLTYLPITSRQLAQQPPSQPMAGQGQYVRRLHVHGRDGTSNQIVQSNLIARRQE